MRISIVNLSKYQIIIFLFLLYLCHPSCYSCYKPGVKSYIESLTKIYSFMKDGHYKPLNCTPVKKVAIIVPYRDRESQLKIFLNNVIPRIYRQQLEFGIYINNVRKRGLGLLP
jgi:hypothetical protein